MYRSMELAIGRFESEDLTSIVVSVVLQFCQSTNTAVGVQMLFLFWFNLF